jgi:hypothetical protein
VRVVIPSDPLGDTMHRLHVGNRNRAAISMITGASATTDDVAIHRRC